MPENANVNIDRENALELVWGAKNIGAVIGLDERQASYLLSQGRLPARKVGKLWVASRGKLRAFFEVEAA